MNMRDLALGAVAVLVASQPLRSAPVPQPAEEPPIKVFLLAGQSNMEGYGGIQTLDELGQSLGMSLLGERPGLLPGREWPGRGNEGTAAEGTRRA